ncbi:glycosyltransferase [Brachybacterium sp. AOP43-C2-M15]|uniref:glycosyltransferase n=1 Tax=Brachybacterium sp. AOP43-C2-M15 TaxID=3457661 RepID=UPI0040331622
MSPGTPHDALRTRPAPLVLGTWTAPAEGPLAEAGPDGSAPARSAPDGSAPAVAAPWEQALPASVWRGVLGDVEVRLRIETGPGSGPAELWAARDGRRQRLAACLTADHRVRLGPDGPQWLWVEGPVASVTWSVDATVQLPPISVVVPTRMREQDATAQAERFARMDCVHEVIVVDQGGTLAGDPGFTRLLAERPGIRLVTQPNLGGSGGYARGMLEAARTPDHAVLFSDDDAVLPEESLRRMATYQALSSTRTILGAPLFSAERPDRLIALAEGVRNGDFQWHASDGVQSPVDLGGTTPEQWAFLRRRGEPNYTGWWATLFPPGTSADLGLPAPFFLKWDDAEYGLRATEHGYRHVVLPGTSVHHPPWTAYRTQMSWTARVLHRNRLATAAAHGAGRGVVASSLLHQAKHVLSGHLLTAELWEEGIDAVLAGPEQWLSRDLLEARTLSAAVVEAWNRENALELDLSPTRDAPLPLPEALLRALLTMLTPDGPPGDGPPGTVLAVPADEVHWRTTLGADAVIVTGEDGAPEAAFAVRGSAMRRAAVRTLRSHAGLARHWRSLCAQYGRALPRHTTAAAWTAVLDAASTDDPSERT